MLTADIAGGDPTLISEIARVSVILAAILAFFGGLGMLAFSQNLRLQAAGGIAVVSSLAFGAGVAVASGNWRAAAMASAIILIVVGAAVLAHRKRRRPGAGYDLPAVRFAAVFLIAMLTILGCISFTWTVLAFAGLWPPGPEGIARVAMDVGVLLAAGLIALRVVVGRPPTFRRMRKRLLSRRPDAD